MRRLTTTVLGLVVLGFAALPALAQTPTGTLTGRVTSEGQGLPGATVSVGGPNIQGTRVVTTRENGDYHVPALPPGVHTVRIELAGYAPVEEQTRVSVGQTTTLDSQMFLEEVFEEILVTGSFENISGTPQAATTFQSDFIEKLPVPRTIAGATLLAPAAAPTGPNEQIAISGNMSFENLFLVNGVVVTENIRGQPFNLFIEDAIEETTISSSGISAEYGRFGGGVINTITKSGGNEFSGSLRASFDNQKWEGETPLTVERDDSENVIYEATLGGRIVRDHLWFFVSGRDRDETGTANTASPTLIPFDVGDKERRLEAKLTFSPTSSHRIVGTYLDIDHDDLGNFFGTVLDLESVTDRKLPQELLAFQYSGVITPSFFVEGQYTEREFLFEGSGSLFTDLIRGTLLVDRNGSRWNSPTFCGVCRDEERSNENFLAKASYFLSTPRLGSHDLVLGYDSFNDIRAADNHQSGSDFRITSVETLVTGSGPGAVLFPRFIPGVTIVQWNPIFETTRGTAFKTNSIFVNDTWRVSDRLTLNLGVRYDENDGKDASRNTVIDDSKLSPRVGATYDLFGNGGTVLHASFGRFVNAVANSQADAGNAGGRPATITWFYEGPEINGPGSSQIPTEEALQMLWDWFESRGGTANLDDVRSINIPGAQTVISGNMKSPHTDEISLGVSKRLGTRGIVRADYVRREGGDFYANQRDLSTGQATLPSGQLVDRSVIGNESSLLERQYDGLHAQARYRLTDRFELGGNWAWSHLRGTWNGETAGSGPVSSDILFYPEYRAFDRHLVRGDLANDQRHRIRAWGSWDLMEIAGNRLNFTLLQNYRSGTPYSAAGNIDPRPFVDNPGYLTPSSSVTYFFGPRGEFTTDTITATDIALSYSFSWNAAGRNLEVFVQPEVRNVFNENGVIATDGFNTTILTAVNDSSLEPFNPFDPSFTPTEGVHWRKGNDFGQPTRTSNFQAPRTFRFSVGIRF